MSLFLTVSPNRPALPIPCVLSSSSKDTSHDSPSSNPPLSYHPLPTRSAHISHPLRFFKPSILPNLAAFSPLPHRDMYGLRMSQSIRDDFRPVNFTPCSQASMAFLIASLLCIHLSSENLLLDIKYPILTGLACVRLIAVAEHCARPMLLASANE